MSLRPDNVSDFQLQKIAAIFNDPKALSIWDVKYAVARVLNMPQADAQIEFDKHAKKNDEVKKLVKEFLENVKTLETDLGLPVIIFQDGVNGAYSAKFSLLGATAAKACDLNARLDLTQSESIRANRNLLKTHNTYLQMVGDAKKGREFNDIIVEYSTQYDSERPLKVWGGQHRISSVSEAVSEANRYHGFRVYFNLTKKQRSEVALISNINMSVSNDTFDRVIEETYYSNKLRQWARNAGMLSATEDFPDSGAKSDKITVKRARSFVTNFYLGKELGKTLSASELDARVYEPHLAQSGVILDPQYKHVMETEDILTDTALLRAGKAFVALNNAQTEAAKKDPKLATRKVYRTKALIESVLCGWSFIAGLLQSHTDRLANHYQIPKTDSRRGIADPLNAHEMSIYKHELDPPTYRGLGTRSVLKDRQRIAQLFLAKSASKDVVLRKSLMDQAVSTVFGLTSLAKGYVKK